MTRRTAIVAALHEELASVLALMPDEHRQTVGGRDFWLGHLHGQAVVAVLSGIGKVAAATTATLLIERFQVGRIVFTGVAGGLGAGVRVGDVVVAEAFLQHDMDASPLFPRHEVPGYATAAAASRPTRRWPIGWPAPPRRCWPTCRTRCRPPRASPSACRHRGCTGA